ncbi:hypothetical protein TNIN_20181 [Trichonephila inaurata madagascariensis]|uniref:Uncharacterized protein n=1 Tax=Trichonephila inaurata madagascariensis TaxID=2747483 RepID=A0A8X6WT27_9ARAC|nr:hypothetical protein TNIN_20181 [Trichonephila inaurata madagascariensis]
MPRYPHLQALRSLSRKKKSFWAWTLASANTRILKPEKIKDIPVRGAYYPDGGIPVVAGSYGRPIPRGRPLSPNGNAGSGDGWRVGCGKGWATIVSGRSSGLESNDPGR